MPTGVAMVDGASLHAIDGASIELPTVTHYNHASTANRQSRSWIAEGTGSRLAFPNLRAISGGRHLGSEMIVAATGGGVVELDRLVQITDPADGDTRQRSISVTASGVESRVELDELRTMIDRDVDPRNGFDAGLHSTIDATDGGEIIAPQFTSLVGVATTIDRDGDLDTRILQTLIDARLVLNDRDADFDALVTATGTDVTVIGGDATFPSLNDFRDGALSLRSGGTADFSFVTNVDGTSFHVEDGVTLSLPSVTAYAVEATDPAPEAPGISVAESQSGAIRQWRAEGPGSRLDLSALTWIAGGESFGSRLVVTASDGGEIDVSNAQQWVDPDRGDTRQRAFVIKAEEAGSTVRLDQLRNVIDRDADPRNGFDAGLLSRLIETDGGRVIVPSIESLVRTEFATDRSPIGTGVVGQPFRGMSPASPGRTSIAVFPPPDPFVTTAEWIAADGRWNDATNWSTGRVPDADDLVRIDSGNDIVVTIDGGEHRVRGITGTDTLRLAAGNLMLTDASTFVGNLTLSPGTSLTATGPDADFTVDGTTEIDGANLYATEGGRLRLPVASGYAHASTSNGQVRTLRAEGYGSRVELPAITSIAGGTHNGAVISVAATNGATIDLRGVTEVVDGLIGNTRGRAIEFESDGIGSEIDLRALTRMSDDDVAPRLGFNAGRYSAMRVTRGGVLRLQQLAEIKGVEFTWDDATTDGVTTLDALPSLKTSSHSRFLIRGDGFTLPSLDSARETDFDVRHGTLRSPQLEQMSGGSIRLSSGGEMVAPALEQIDGASFFVRDGISLSLPSVLTYDHGGDRTKFTRTLQVSGSGSRLAFPNLEAIRNGNEHGSKIRIEAIDGGSFETPSLSTILDGESGDTRQRAVYVIASGHASVIDLGRVHSFVDRDHDPHLGFDAGLYSQIVANQGGSILAPELAHLRGIAWSIDGSDAIDPSDGESRRLTTESLESVRDSRLILGSGTHRFPELVEATGTGILVSHGHAVFPGLTSLRHGGVRLRNGGTADLSSLTDIDDTSLIVEGGVTLSLPGVTSYRHAADERDKTTTLRAEGPGSRLELANLSRVVGSAERGSLLSFEALSGGTIVTPALRDIKPDGDGVGVRRIGLVAEGIGSTIDVTSLERFVGTHPQVLDPSEASFLAVRYGGVIEFPADEVELIGIRLESGPAGSIDDWSLPDLVVTGFTAPAESIGDPAGVELAWEIHNEGDSAGPVTGWNDVVILSRNAILGDGDDEVVARVRSPAGLDPGDSYGRAESILLPASTSGRFHLFLITNGDGEIRETGAANNNSALHGPIDVMPIAHADLIVDAIDVPAKVAAGAPFLASWKVTNQGPGITNRGDWIDRLYFAHDPDGNEPLEGTERQRRHFGQLAPGGDYEATVTLTIPFDVSGELHLIVETAALNAPFEFRFDDNNVAASDALSVSTPPMPDLATVELIAPSDVAEGTRFEVSWSVENVGAGIAEGPWVDRVWLRELGEPQRTGESDVDSSEENLIELGRFAYVDALSIGDRYTRSESILIPSRIRGVFELLVDINAEGDLDELGDGNNVVVTSEPITVNAQPRPDLRIDSIVTPERVPAGENLAVEYVIANLGTRGSEDASWVDRVYLSLDTTIDPGDILIAETERPAKLSPGESYRMVTDPVTVPLRYRGDVYVLVETDATEMIPEWPNETNNLRYSAVFVEAAPLSDFVVGDVIVPTQAVAGATIPVRFTVTNVGSAATHGDGWSESVWLTRDKTRPHPAKGDRLLWSGSHQGRLPRDAGYDRELDVRVPDEIESGVWHVTPWVDPFDEIAEDTLAANVNPDDPGQLDNNNYRAREISIVGKEPDLVVAEVSAPAVAQGGDQITVTWRVENRGLSDAGPGGWIDRIYLSDSADPSADGTRSTVLAERRHDQSLAAGDAYTRSVTVTLSPSARGSHLVVVTDDDSTRDAGIELPGFFAGFADASPDIRPVTELDEENNATVRSIDVTPVPANLRVVSFDVPTENFSGEPTTIRYTVENVGEHPVWPGTSFWRDFLWVSADPTFIRDRASFLGEVLTTHPGSTHGVSSSPAGEPSTVMLLPGETYTVETTVSLPEGAAGDLYLHVHLNANNDQSPLLFPYHSRIALEEWYPADSGVNDAWLEHFSRWAYEDPADNVATTPLPVVYREADLELVAIEVSDSARSGETVSVTYTVMNSGERATRVAAWTDRLFLSRDASLDNADHQLALVGYVGDLAPGESYTRSLDVRLPDGVEGEFHLIVFADSAARQDRTRRPSDIGYRLTGLEFELPGSLAPWDLASVASRESARGRVREFHDEGNNVGVVSLPIELGAVPDLRVVNLVAPTRATRAQEFEVTYSVENRGDDTVSGQSEWEDHVYLSRDRLLDLSSDLFLGSVTRDEGLAAGASYTRTETFSLPNDLLGPYYVFVITDPDRGRPEGDVFEGDHERNNDLPSDVPMLIELPDPVDLQVTVGSTPTSVSVGQPLSLEWVVTNHGEHAVTGRWSDTVYLSTDPQWDRGDAAVGRVEFRGTLGPGESYTSTLDAVTPAVTPGNYRAIVRADIDGQVYEGDRSDNNASASANTIDVAVPELLLDEPTQLTIAEGDELLYEIHVPAGRTLRVRWSGADDVVPSEIFLRHGAAPTSVVHDAAGHDAIGTRIIATVPSTEAGSYYLLLRAYESTFGVGSASRTGTLHAELLPLMIDDVRTDFGGDTGRVTVTVRGAGFHPDAIVKLVRPGFAEYIPIATRFVDATEIRATFDWEEAVRGLYDVQVIQPGDPVVTVPYRFQVEPTIEAEVTVGIGGPRHLFAGDAGAYGIALQNLGNVDAAYVRFDAGVPALGINSYVYNLPFTHFTSNLRGEPGGQRSIPWAELDSAANRDGHRTADGYAFDVVADGVAGMTFQVETYPGLRQLHDRAWEALKTKLYEAFPEHAATDLLAGGPEALDAIFPGLTAMWQTFGAIPDWLTVPLIPFEFHVVASATSMTHDEYVADALREAGHLRQAILDDTNAPPVLVHLAANPERWESLYRTFLEEAGWLVAEDAIPSVRRDPELVSQLAMLAGAVAGAPVGDDSGGDGAGSGVVETLFHGDPGQLFEQVRRWYGHDAGRLVDTEANPPRFSADSLSGFGLLDNPNPVAQMPRFESRDRGLERATHFQAMKVYVPWVPFERRGQGIPADYQVDGIVLNDDQPFFPLNLGDEFDQSRRTVGGDSMNGVSMVGPFTLETGGFVPAGEPLPFTVDFQNAPSSTRDANRVRVVVPLDEGFDSQTFRLGEIRIGELVIRVPPGRSHFQGAFDLAETLGFDVLVSAGIDQRSGHATWLIEAIDPMTGERLQDADGGLLPANDALGHGAGFVRYSVELRDTLESGTEIAAEATVRLDNAPGERTEPLRYVADVDPPTSSLNVEPVDSNGASRVSWEVRDEPDGSGFRHVSLYVSEDDGEFRLWQRQLTDGSGTATFLGQPGRVARFLAISSDRAGNRELPPPGIFLPSDGSRPPFGPQPESSGIDPSRRLLSPSDPPSEPTHPVFTRALQGIPSSSDAVSPSEFASSVRPFVTRSFASGFVSSGAGIGPIAIVETPPGDVLVSGGEARNEIYRLGEDGGVVGDAWATLPFPIHDLQFDLEGRLWATTGGGPLLRLSPDDGTVLGTFGDGLTFGLAVDPQSGQIAVGSRHGVERFDPDIESFTRLSRDRDLRVGSLAYDADGVLWGVRWPQRDTVVRFEASGRAVATQEFNEPIDSIAFGQPGTELEGLLFVSHPGTDHSRSDPDLGDERVGVTMIDVASNRRVPIARGGSRADRILATSDGRLLVSQSSQVDQLSTIVAPQIVATNPPDQSVAAIPLGRLSVTFSEPMWSAGHDAIGSVINPAHYTLTSSDGTTVAIREVTYDDDSRTAYLFSEALGVGDFTMSVAGALRSGDGFPLGSDFSFAFRTVRDFAGLVDVRLTGTRIDRQAETVSYDAEVANIGDLDLLVPMFLTLMGDEHDLGRPAGDLDRDHDGRWIVGLDVTSDDGTRLKPGESTTATTIRLLAPETGQTDFWHGFAGSVADVSGIEFVSEPPTDVVAGETYRYDAIVSADGENASYFRISQGPDGMAVDHTRGTVVWQTSEDSPQQADVVLQVLGDRGGWAETTWTVRVAGGNRSPWFFSVPDDIVSREGERVERSIDVFDPDGDSVRIRIESLPPGATFDPLTGTLAWEPMPGAAGIYDDVTIFATDGVNTVSHVFDWVVTPSSHAPLFETLARPTLHEGERWVYQIPATSPDQRPLHFSSDSLPDGATLHSSHGELRWDVGYAAAGEHVIPRITVTAGDDSVTTGDDSVTTEIVVEVLAGNGVPRFDPLGDWVIDEGQSITIVAFAFDPDDPDFRLPVRLPDGTLDPPGDMSPVLYAAEGLPDGATFDADTATFVWTPDHDAAGRYEVTFVATDDGGGADTPATTRATATIIVRDDNRSPMITPLQNFSLERHRAVTIPVVATDPDGDPIALSAATSASGLPLPDFITFTDHGNGTGAFSCGGGLRKSRRPRRYVARE